MEEATQTAATHDQETRSRLLEAATRLFGERGFNHVTVRDICSGAGANLAAVNYHFRDKWGLYKEVLQPMIDYMRQTYQLAHEASTGMSPEERLRNYIRVLLHRCLGGGKDSWQAKLMGREMTDPTPGLDLVVEHVIRPNSARLGSLVSELMGCPVTDGRVGLCVGSIQTQCVAYINNPIISRLIPDLKFTPEVIEHIADHIAEFSLAGIRAVAQKKREGTK